MGHHLSKNTNIVPESQIALVVLQPFFKEEREKICQSVFETLNYAAFYSECASILALYAHNKTTGLAIDCGEFNTTVVPIYDGYQMPHAIKAGQFGANHVTQQLSKLLSASNLYHAKSAKEMEHLLFLKEEYSFLQDDLSSVNQDSFIDCTLPDGTRINSIPSHMLSSCAESVYYGQNLWEQDKSIIPLIQSSLTSVSSADLKPLLLNHVICIGGGSLVRNFETRLKNELLSKVNKKVQVYANLGRQFEAWTGATVLSNLSVFSQMIISKDDYEVHGPSITVNRMLF